MGRTGMGRMGRIGIGIGIGIGIAMASAARAGRGASSRPCDHACCCCDKCCFLWRLRAAQRHVAPLVGFTNPRVPGT